MKLNIENYLQEIDASFKNKNQKDRYMIYIMIFGLIFAFAYTFFWESSLASFEEKNRQIATVKSNINTDKAYLKANPTTVIAMLDKDIKKTKQRLKAQKETNAYIKSKIETISSLIYDEVTWGEYLHSISINAKKYNVKVIEFTNKYVKTDKSFGHILNVILSTQGDYISTLKFINSLEQSELVIDLHSINIAAKEKPYTDLNISVWGITY